MSGAVRFSDAGAPRADATPRRGEPLTRRELQVVEAVADGLSNEQIARRLGLGVNTVKAHLVRASAKLGATGRTHLVALAYRARLLPADAGPVGVVKPGYRPRGGPAQAPDPAPVPAGFVLVPQRALEVAEAALHTFLAGSPRADGLAHAALATLAALDGGQRAA